MISKFTQLIIIMQSFVFLSFSYAQEEEAAATSVESQSITDVAQEQWSVLMNLWNVIVEFLVNYSFQVLGGFIILGLGWFVGGKVANWVLKLMQGKRVDITVSKFTAGIVKLMVIIFAAIVALGKFGINIAPIIAGISVIGFAASFALQGPLSNYAAGITLIFTKPFKVGDIVEVAGVNGEIVDIMLPRTEMKTVDGVKIVVPNHHIIGEIIQNYSDWMKLDLTLGISYNSDIDTAINVIKKVLNDNDRVSKEKDPRVGVAEFADSSINITARCWTRQVDHYEALFEVNKAIFDEFAKSNIEIPFPQRDVHVFDQSKNRLNV